MHLILSRVLLKSYCYYFHITDEETERLHNLPMIVQRTSGRSRLGSQAVRMQSLWTVGVNANMSTLGALRQRILGPELPLLLKTHSFTGNTPSICHSRSTVASSRPLPCPEIWKAQTASGALWLQKDSARGRHQQEAGGKKEKENRLVRSLVDSLSVKVFWTDCILSQHLLPGALFTPASFSLWVSLRSLVPPLIPLL